MRSFALCSIVLVLSACKAVDVPTYRRFETRTPVAGPAFAPEVESAFESEARRGDEIVVDGTWVSTGAKVVLWLDPGGYNAYRTVPHFGTAGPVGMRYRTRSVEAGRDAIEAIDQFVLHYDVCGLSRECFRVLHDQRELSVHFLIDVDGTIYQTLDVREEAWHAKEVNSRSVGVEIAHIGAYPRGQTEPIEAWYEPGPGGLVLDWPEELGDGGVRTPDFVGRPARPELIEGRIGDATYLQMDFTEEQYDALVKLSAALVRALPNLSAELPRDGRGGVRTSPLEESELATFQGILGHYHLNSAKRDPGPAFHWERFSRELAHELARP